MKTEKSKKEGSAFCRPAGRASLLFAKLWGKFILMFRFRHKSGQYDCFLYQI